MFERLTNKLHHHHSENNEQQQLQPPPPSNTTRTTLACDLGVLRAKLTETASKSLPELPKHNSKKAWNFQTCKELVRISEKARLSSETVLTQELYQEYQKSGDRKSYEDPYFLRRAQLTGYVLRCYASDELHSECQFLNRFLEDICNEPTWVVPAHTRCKVDLFNAETAFSLAQIVEVLGYMIDDTLIQRIYREVDKRVLTPYEQSGRSEWWYSSSNNWNGVCNSAVGACFLLVPTDPDRAIKGVAQALDGLKTYLNDGFGLDGATAEGAGYWQYGLSYLTAFFEMIRARSLGKIDLLQDTRIANIVSSASKLQLGANKFAPFGDAEEDKMTFSPGFISRLAERLNQPGLLNMLALPEGGSFSQSTVALSKTALILRDFAWWDGNLPRSPIELSDSILPNTGVARMVINSSQAPQLVIMGKAGNNGEEHNHCDVGSIVVHFDGENYITDPGKGLYTKQYFDPKTRYVSDWPKSLAHSVPIISQQLQGVGSQYSGQLSNIEVTDRTKTIHIDMTRAYTLPELKSCRRQIIAYEEAGAYITEISDSFEVTKPVKVNCQFMTYLKVRQDAKNRVSLLGKAATMVMTIAEPQNEHAELIVQELEDLTREQKKPKPLRKISVLPYQCKEQQTIKVRLELRNNNVQ
jgi:hypothetical protein